MPIDPLTLSPSMWFAADQGAFTTAGGATPATANNDPIGQLNDLSGNTRHLTQGTAGLRPTLATTGINSLPAVKFLGGLRLTTGVLGAPLTQPNTVCVVLKNVDKTQRNIFDGAATGGRNLLWVNNNNFGAYAGGARYDYAAAEPGVYIYTVQYNGVTSRMRRNGAEIFVFGDVSTQAMGGLSIGTDNTGSAGNAFNGWIREIICFNSALSTADIEQVEIYLAARAGITNLYQAATSGTIGSNGWYLEPPPLWDGVTKKLVMYHHGRGEGALAPLKTEALMVPMIQGVLAAGYFICASDALTQTNWGNQAAQDAQVALWELLRNREAWSHLIFWGRSMGGMTAQSGMADVRYGNIAGFYGTYPVCDLDEVYDNNAGTFAAEILGAYSSTSGTYAAQTAGFNPIDAAASIWSGKPWRAIASDGDTIIDKTENADAMALHIAGQASENTVVEHTGDHGDATSFNVSDLTSFLSRCTQMNAPLLSRMSSAAGRGSFRGMDRGMQ